MPIGPHIGVNRAEYLYMSLKSLIVYAYRAKPYQVSGPDWLEQERSTSWRKMASACDFAPFTAGPPR